MTKDEYSSPALDLKWLQFYKNEGHIPLLRTGSCHFTTETKITTTFMAYSTAKRKITVLNFSSLMTALRTQAFVHGRTAQHRERCIDFGTCEDLVQNTTSLRVTSNHANLVTSSWRRAENLNLHHSGMTAQWHPSFKSSQRYGLKF